MNGISNTMLAKFHREIEEDGPQRCNCAKDRIVHPDYARRIARTYEHARLIFIEGGAHGFSRTRDAQAIARLTGFAGSNLGRELLTTIEKPSTRQADGFSYAGKALSSRNAIEA